MLGSCCACAKGAPAHSAVTRTARRALPVELGMGRYNHTNATKNERSTGSARERHGLFRYGAFQSGPDSPPINPIFGSGISPQARTAGHLTFQPLVRFRARCDLPFARSTLPSSVARLLHTAG
jgi:hypothetical protein